ncbi:MAG: MmgE/PrpD family protein [Kiloniellaceae bacterium]
MVLAADISRAFYAVNTAQSSADVTEHLHTLIVDALACILGGSDSEIVRIAGQAAGAAAPGPGRATILPGGPAATPADAALVNGTMLRSLDFMDVYVDADVSHPSESVPAALACAEAFGARGRDFLDSLLAAFTLHAHLAGTVALHRNGLHHVGHAAWVVPLIAARLSGQDEAAAANALNLSASGFIVPEGFSRGHVANVKAMAFPLIAKHAIELAELGTVGLAAQPGACEEVADLLSRITGTDLDPAALVPPQEASRVRAITLKAYPAQYALQPLVAAAAAFHRAEAPRLGAITRIVVRAARQTVARTADPAKFKPASREAADHSLPFCVASGLIDGGLTAEALHRGRWRDADILRLTGMMEVEPLGSGEGFAVGHQSIDLTFADGSSTSLDCVYPAEGTTWRRIACDKLATFAAGRCDAGRVVAAVEALEDAASVGPLVAALRGQGATRAQAS